ncbi:hypothetical protein HYPSUDRAFT_37553 [Hypholoma sublateritium FD-334 SS-4]|uniref:Protein kinase domain-containing protein n=1 Tax=Hypholoma sublateritium (strain FD-334 SS-4) TaxID=945553 RepID=A0A0D2PAD4_HYPSF|nr:hypothetical protein HYPSUDRAFT_37553 [Hypholoma sublateritium FD-334 SS-4]
MSLLVNRSKAPHDYLLKHWEEFWVVHQPFLLEQGYRLPDRYDPNWIPSWRGKKKADPFRSPDSSCLQRWRVLDAYRISDGVRVMLKVVEVKEDIPILEYLGSPALRADKRNHTVPILDKVPVPGEDGRVWIVMPYLLRFQAFVHPFQYVSEIVECIGQFLEGLEFMHEHGVAHRDACFFNLMVDSAKLVPDGDISLNIPYMTIDKCRYVKPVVRRSVAPLAYYFIDFEASVRFPPEEKNPRCVGIFGQEPSVPELSDTVPYDPFMVDVYQLGSIFPRLFRDYDGMEFLIPLYQAMTYPDPRRRPTAAQANSLYNEIISGFSESDMAQRIWDKRISLKHRRKIEFPQPKRTMRTRISSFFHIKVQ